MCVKIWNYHENAVSLRQNSIATMRIVDEIKRIIGRGQVIYDQRMQPWLGGFELTQHDFSNAIWYNMCDLITDIAEDVQLTDRSGASPLDDRGAKYAAFRAFYYAWGKAILQAVYDNGFVVLGYDNERKVFMRMIEGTDYNTPTEDDKTIVQPHNPNIEVYVMKSATFVARGKSDRALCRGWLDYLDDVLNGSATMCRKLGIAVMASPKNSSSLPTPVVLTEQQAKEMEQKMETEHGILKNQRIVNLFPREMNFQPINIAGMDTRLQERIKTAILVLADRVKIPANQVAIIDALSSKSMANGSEIREGDKLRYKTFRRLFEHTFKDMAMYFKLQIDYAIDGEPLATNGEVVAKDE